MEQGKVNRKKKAPFAVVRLHFLTLTEPLAAPYPTWSICIADVVPTETILVETWFGLLRVTSDFSVLFGEAMATWDGVDQAGVRLRMDDLHWNGEDSFGSLGFGLHQPARNPLLRPLQSSSVS